MSKTISSISDLEKEQYAIIEFGSIFIPGDERSRTNPGHGYPERYETTTNIIVFSSKDEWEKEIAIRVSRAYSKDNFKAVIIKPVKVETKVSVSLT